MQIAAKFPQLSFVCCALEYDFVKKVNKIPQNVTVYYSLTSGEYYQLMAGAYFVLMPLLTEEVSGLINIAIASQSGIPCLVSKFEFTQIYYPEELRDWLVDGSEVEVWIEHVKKILDYKAEEYNSEVILFQNHIITQFGPETALEVLRKMIRT